MVPRGSVYGFLGPNGSGKTTTIKTLMGFRSPDGGRARVLGHEVVEEGLEVRAKGGYVGETSSPLRKHDCPSSRQALPEPE